MNPWARIEYVPIPSPDSKIDSYIYHMNGNRFDMTNNVIIFAAEQNSNNLEEIFRIPWALKGYQSKPKGKHLMELVTSIELPNLRGKLANIRLEVCASNNFLSHKNWHF